MNNLLAISTGGIVGIIVGAAILLLLIIIIGWFISTMNAMIRLRNNVEEGWSTIDVYLKKRYDLIPNLVETVKGYAKHENSTLEAVIRARNAAMSAGGGVEGKAAAENALSGTLKSLFALSEAYPNLKADSHFLDLQKQLQSLESEISQARRYYNGVVKTYNNKIMVFPSSIVAKMKKFEKKAFFEIAEAERANVKVSF
ncbi:MAG: LemA family protein [Firmicutes bacterium]|nr:LemA family protein [Bacillota bacterium]